MSTPEILSILSSLVGIIGGPLSLYFSWKAANRSHQAVEGAKELSRRLTKRELFPPQPEDTVK